MSLTLFKDTETSEVAEQSVQRMTVAILYGLVREGPAEEGEGMSLVGVRVELRRTRGKTFQKGHKPCSGKTPELQGSIVIGAEETARPPPGDRPHNLLSFSKGAKCP